MSDDILDYRKLPCGCECWAQIVQGDRQFVMRPCSPDCEYYQYAIAETKRRGKAVEHRRDVEN